MLEEILVNSSFKKYHSNKSDIGKVAPNILIRDFHLDKQNEKCVTDVTISIERKTKIYNYLDSL